MVRCAPRSGDHSLQVTGGSCSVSGLPPWPQPLAEASLAAWYWRTIDVRHGCMAATLMSRHEGNLASGQPDSFPLFDRAGYASLAGGLLVVLITFFTSYSHVDLLRIHIPVNQQIGIPFLVAALAALVGEDEVFSEGVVKLASNDRCADQRAREREARAREREANEAARERDRAARRTRIQAGCLVAQCRFLLSGTSRNRLQLSEALALLMEDIKPPES